MPDVDLILLLVAVAVVGVVAAVAVGRVQGGLDEPVRSRRDNALPERRLDDTDLARARFSVGLRGYRMDEVDAALDRVQHELRERDAELERLRAALREQQPAQPVEPVEDDGVQAQDEARDEARDEAGADAGFGPGR
jgi:DivIVA domain-containing protein